MRSLILSIIAWPFLVQADEELDRLVPGMLHSRAVEILEIHGYEIDPGPVSAKVDIEGGPSLEPTDDGYVFLDETMLLEISSLKGSSKVDHLSLIVVPRKGEKWGLNLHYRNVLEVRFPAGGVPIAVFELAGTRREKVRASRDTQPAASR